MGLRSLADGLLFTAGLLLVVGALVGSAVLAPSLAAGSDAGDGGPVTLVGSQGGGPGWHEFGSVYRLDGRTVTWRASAADSHFEVESLGDGRLVTGFTRAGETDCGPYEPPCPHTGFQILDGPDDTVESEFAFPVRSVKNSEVHAAEPLPGGGFVVSDMEYERVFTVEGGEITWQWNASQRYDAPPDPTRTDWLHINDVNVLGPDRYLVSVRNANQLLVLERGSGVVEVVNADDGGSDASCLHGGQLRDTDGDGDVLCGDPAVLDHQHNPHVIAADRILVADSDNDRVVELERTGGSWEVAWRLTGADGVALHWPRDADRLPNGNTLVTDTLNRRLVEVDSDGEAVWSVRTDRIPYEADRLPAGESMGVPAGEGAVVGATDGRGGLPVLGEVGFLLRAVFPWLPYWFEGLQLVATLVGTGLMAAGVYIRYR
jgi:hypothetical protein